jgi:hypothetical protein
MKKRHSILLFFSLLSGGCGTSSGSSNGSGLEGGTRIIFLHHSTGENIWNGGVKSTLDKHNSAHGTRYNIEERGYPSEEGYGWNNYPYDYWNIWVKNAGPSPYRGQDTLEILSQKYKVIVFKHCYPVSELSEGGADVTSEEKTIGNYKAQYEALKQKMLAFKNTHFILWTGAVHIEGNISEEQAQLTRDFFQWVTTSWDQKGDNIFLWDFYALETEGGLYLKKAYSAGDSHPNEAFSRTVAPTFVQRLVDVLEGRGDTGSLTGK